MQPVIPEWLDRTELLLGEESVLKLANSNVLVAGLGGVGSWAVEFIARSGVGNITIVDSDTIDKTNINRQLPATHKTVGMSKTTVMKERLLDINTELNLTVFDSYLNDETLHDVLKINYDVVVDAIDTLSPKFWFLYFCLQRNLTVFSSMGSAGRLNPLKIEVADISKTYNCALARSLRKRLHRKNIYTGLTTVFSAEQVPNSVIREQEGRNKKTVLGTISFVPAAFGCVLASLTIRHLIKGIHRTEIENTDLL